MQKAMKAMTHCFKQFFALIRNISNFLPYSFSISLLSFDSNNESKWTFPSSIAAILTLSPHLVVFSLHGDYAEIPGLLAPDSFSNFILILI